MSESAVTDIVMNSSEEDVKLHYPWDVCIVFDLVTDEEMAAAEESCWNSEDKVARLREQKAFIDDCNKTDKNEHSFARKCFEAGLQVSLEDSSNRFDSRAPNSAMRNPKLPTRDNLEPQALNSWEASRAWIRGLENPEGDYGVENGFINSDMFQPPTAVADSPGMSYFLIRASRQRLMEEAQRIGMMVDVVDDNAEATDDDKDDEGTVHARVPRRPKDLQTFSTEEFNALRYDKGYYWTPSRESDADVCDPAQLEWNGRDEHGLLAGNTEYQDKIQGKGYTPPTKMHTGYRFFSSQRQRLIFSILSAPTEEGGAGINLGALQAAGWVKMFFPTHDRVMLESLTKRWGSMWWNWWFYEDWQPALLNIFSCCGCCKDPDDGKPSGLCCLKCCKSSPGYVANDNRPSLVSDIRDYFGEQVALYFGFLGFYTRWLFVPAFMGTIVYFIQTNPEEAGQKSLAAFCIMMSIWSAFFMKFWTRLDNHYSYEWDSMPDQVSNVAPRPEFIADKVEKQGFYCTAGWIDLEECEWGEHPPEGIKKRDWDPPRNKVYQHDAHCCTTRSILYGIDVPLFLTLATCLVAATCAFLVFRLWSNQTFGNTWGGFLAGVVQGIVIYLLNFVFETVAFSITNMENQRTQSEWEDSFIMKLFGFQFINTYFGLFYIAFIKYFGSTWNMAEGRYNAFSSILTFGLQDRCFPSNSTRNAFESFNNFSNSAYQNCQFSDAYPADAAVCDPDASSRWGVCYQELQSALIGILFTKIVSDAFFDYIYPWIMNCLAERKLAKALAEEEGDDKGGLSAGDTLKTFSKTERLYHYEVQIGLSQYPTPLYDYNQLILNFGFIVLFGAAWPVTPLVVLCYNVSQALIDQKKILLQYQRPMFDQCASIGIWSNILTMLSFFGVFTNVLILVITTDAYQTRFDLTSFETAVYAVCIEHFIIVCRLAVHYIWRDMPSRVIRMRALDDFEDDFYRMATASILHDNDANRQVNEEISRLKAPGEYFEPQIPPPSEEDRAGGNSSGVAGSASNLEYRGDAA